MVVIIFTLNVFHPGFMISNGEILFTEPISLGRYGAAATGSPTASREASHDNVIQPYGLSYDNGAEKAPAYDDTKRSRRNSPYDVKDANIYSEYPSSSNV